jgi:hypothetical protein
MVTADCRTTLLSVSRWQCGFTVWTSRIGSIVRRSASPPMAERDRAGDGIASADALTAGGAGGVRSDPSGW